MLLYTAVSDNCVSSRKVIGKNILPRGHYFNKYFTSSHPTI